MTAFIAKRMGSALLTLLFISILTFSISHLAGDPASAIAGREASAADIARIRQFYGFDRPITVQYLDWASDVLRGDFGQSYHYRQPVSALIMARLPITFTLGVAGLLFALVVGIPLGLLGAIRQNSLIDRFAVLMAAIGQAMPSFWLALVGIVVFGVTLRWLPISGSSGVANFILPSVVLGFFAMPAILRLTRAGMIEALESDYVRTARAKGLRPARIVLRHSLRNVLVSIVSISSIQLGSMLGGSIVIEQVFALQGIGWLGYDATVRSDLPVLQAITILVAAFYVALTLIADIINAFLDPRIGVT